MKIFYLSVLAVLLGFSAFADSLPSNGLGLTLNEWELNHKSTGQGIIGTMYDQIEIVFQNNKVVQIELNLELPISIEKAVEFAISLLPRDAKFVRQYVPELPQKNPNDPKKTFEYKKIFLYSSEFLQSEFHYQYNEYSNPLGVFRVIIARGNEPILVSRLREPNPKSPFYFGDCDKLQNKYPDGVPEGHPSYRPALDRNRNGWACEATPR
jgi:Excalibur calcium-binding domain